MSKTREYQTTTDGSICANCDAPIAPEATAYCIDLDGVVGAYCSMTCRAIDQVRARQIASADDLAQFSKDLLIAALPKARGR
jgi:hypothetical protein